jgi:4-amino-4-deoxy-L-arabinose transferase-like glycosyltransferase
MERLHVRLGKQGGATKAALPFAILLAIVAVLYFRLPKDGVIWWSDASRNALNGAFVLDFVRALPFHDPTGFAYGYYQQWPALTILFYPPLYYVALAAVYAVFGVSEASADLVACLFLLALGWGAYRLSSRWLAPLPALAAAILTIGIPEMAYWGQQPMLDIPSYALLMWSAVWLMRHLDSGRQRDLLLAVLFLVLAIYTKYNSMYFAAGLVAALFAQRGWRILLDRRVWWAAAFGVLLLLPLVAIFLAFGRYNLDQAAAVTTIPVPRWSLDRWTYYARIISESVTWPVLALSLLYVIAAVVWRRFRLPWPDALLLTLSTAAGYAFYSLVAVREQRYDLFLIYPIAVGAILFVDRALARFGWRWAVSLALAGAVLVAGQITKPAPFVRGMREAADLVGAQASGACNIGFWGRWDGAFIFDMRAYERRPDLGVMRLDKLLVSDLVVSFELGAKDNGLDADRILDALRQYHVQYVVFQSDFHDELPSVHALAALLDSDKFEALGSVPITANYHFSSLTRLTLYRLREQLPPGRVPPPMQIKMIGKSLG